MLAIQRDDDEVIICNNMSVVCVFQLLLLQSKGQKHIYEAPKKKSLLICSAYTARYYSRYTHQFTVAWNMDGKKFLREVCLPNAVVSAYLLYNV